jgi:hypothetical protein
MTCAIANPRYSSEATPTDRVLRAFGIAAYIHVPASRVSVLQTPPKNLQCTFLDADGFVAQAALMAVNSGRAPRSVHGLTQIKVTHGGTRSTSRSTREPKGAQQWRSGEALSFHSAEQRIFELKTHDQTKVDVSRRRTRAHHQMDVVFGRQEDQP